MAKLGAPTLYRSEMDEHARKLCLLGYTDAQLGVFFGVTEQTINNWKIEHPSFFESIKSGKDIADCEVVDSLRNRALNGDTTASIFWLKNRQPRNWRDKQDIEMTVTQSPFELFTGASADTTPKEEEE
jgi:DNA-binding XRE family transcriptional regulator